MEQYKNLLSKLSALGIHNKEQTILSTYSGEDYYSKIEVTFKHYSNAILSFPLFQLKSKDLDLLKNEVFDGLIPLLEKKTENKENDFYEWICDIMDPFYANLNRKIEFSVPVKLVLPVSGEDRTHLCFCRLYADVWNVLSLEVHFHCFEVYHEIPRFMCFFEILLAILCYITGRTPIKCIFNIHSPFAYIPKGKTMEELMSEVTEETEWKIIVRNHSNQRGENANEFLVKRFEDNDVGDQRRKFLCERLRKLWIEFTEKSYYDVWLKGCKRIDMPFAFF